MISGVIVVASAFRGIIAVSTFVASTAVRR